jgi:hypothetical protein
MARLLQTVDLKAMDNGLIALGLLGIPLLVYFAHEYRHLSHNPGPLSASLTNIVRRSWVMTGNAHLIHTELHRKYGKAIRVAPNIVLVSDPTVIPALYRFSEPYQKVRLVGFCL